MADIKIKLVKSISGRKKSHIATAVSLGLTKIGKTVTQPDNAATQGKIREIDYLVEIVK
ncbi:MAG: 50S ribosomal protein L30 [Oscillospiraceae bacterium]|jgi:large subunit ribosomal protein L30|nr:50S ribosomal protein L30 [Oscillospiraceae bacterium]